MKLRVKNIGLSTGGPLIAILNAEDASKLDLHPLDRIRIVKGRKETITGINIARNRSIKIGEIGLFDEVLEKLKVKQSQFVDVDVEIKPESIKYIKKKLDGERLSEEEINTIVRNVVRNELTEVETTYFVSACYSRELDLKEIVALTKAIVENGERLKLDSKIIVDKHGSGGTPGNRTTMIIVPIVAAAGLVMPKTSSRAITSASVTGDTEVLIEENGKIKLVEIGRFVDPFLKTTNRAKTFQGFVKNYKNIRVPVFDSKMRIRFVPLTGMYRHKNNKKILEITTQLNRKVEVTEDHSLFVLKEGRIISHPSSELKIGDYIITPRRIKNYTNIEELNLVKEFKKVLSKDEAYRIFISNIKKRPKKIKFWRDYMRYWRGYTPLSLIDNFNEINQTHNIRAADAKYGNEIPAIIKVNKSLAKFLGYFVAEGVISKDNISLHFGSHEKEILEDIRYCIKDCLGLEATISQRPSKKTETVVYVNGKIVSLLFKKIFCTGNSAYTKRIPNIIFNFPNELKLAFLEAYINGDGSRRKEGGFEVTTVSKTLASQIQYLLAFLGNSCSVSTIKERERNFGKYISKCKRVYRLYISKLNYLTSSNLIPIKESGLRSLLSQIKMDYKENSFKMGYKLHHQQQVALSTLCNQLPAILIEKISLLNMLIEGDLSFLPIKEIKEVDYKEDFVYDLCVDGYENFLGGFGPIFLHNSGTADCMETLANVTFPVDKIKEIVKKTNACMVWSGTMGLASADDKFIKIEHPLSLDPTGVLVSSIMAKKKAVGATHVLIDIAYGHEAKVKTKKKALLLRKLFRKVGRKLGIKVDVMMSNGSQPIGNGIGPSLEARDVLYVLRNDEKAPKDLKEKAIYMAGRILSLVGKGDEQVAREILESGKAYKKMREIIKAQEGNPNIKPENIKLGEYSFDVEAARNGIVKEFKNKVLAKLARIAGAPTDKGAGVYLYAHKGDSVKKKEKLLTIYSDNSRRLEYAVKLLNEESVVEIE